MRKKRGRERGRERERERERESIFRSIGLGLEGTLSHLCFPGGSQGRVPYAPTELEAPEKETRQPKAGRKGRWQATRPQR